MVKTLLKSCFIYWVCVVAQEVHAQDPQLSQYFAAPLYLNPAFTGESEKWRAGMTHRRQWLGLDHHYTTTSAYADLYIGKISSGLGVILNEHVESVFNLHTREFGLSYAYDLKLRDNYKNNDDMHLRVGAQFSTFQKSFDFDKLLFGSQIEITTGNQNLPSGEQFRREGSNPFLSISAGLLIYEQNWWLGMSLHHINEPNQSFLDNSESLLEQKLSAHGGLRLKLWDGPRNNRLSGYFQRAITLVYNYRRQGGLQQLDLGAQAFLEPFIAGISYRGIPLEVINDLVNHESFVFLTGVKLHNGFTFGYSYDLTVSDLRGATGGSHEISLSFQWGVQARFYRKLRCPAPQL